MSVHFHFKIFTPMNLSEPLHVIDQVIQGGVLSSCLFALYLDDLSL